MASYDRDRKDLRNDCDNVDALLLPCCMAAGCSPLITCTTTEAESVTKFNWNILNANTPHNIYILNLKYTTKEK